MTFPDNKIFVSLERNGVFVTFKNKGIFVSLENKRFSYIQIYILIRFHIILYYKNKDIPYNNNIYIYNFQYPNKLKKNMEQYYDINNENKHGSTIINWRNTER